MIAATVITMGKGLFSVAGDSASTAGDSPEGCGTAASPVPGSSDGVCPAGFICSGVEAVGVPGWLLSAVPGLAGLVGLAGAPCTYRPPGVTASATASSLAL